MPRPRKQPPLPIEIFQSHDANGTPTGIWQGFLPVIDEHGKQVMRDGKAYRLKRQASGPDGKANVEAKLRVLMQEMEAENARRRANLRPDSTGCYGLHDWLRYWLNEIKKPTMSYNYYDDMAYAIEGLVIPNIEDVELPDLRAHHVEAMLKALRATGSQDKPFRAFARLRMALKAAAARPRETGLWDNPIGAVQPPAPPKFKVDPPSIPDVRAVMAAARTQRNTARWTVGWALGMRPGEVLALRCDDFWIIDSTSGQPVAYERWARLDFERDRGRYVGYLRVKENLYRRRWEHGCADPHTCNAGKYHREQAIPCPGKGPRHERYHKPGIACPPIAKPCQPGCIKHGRMCKKRHGGVAPDGTLMPGGQVRKDPKSEAGKRGQRLHPAMTLELINHLAAQDAESEAAGDLWRGTGALFATPIGGLINERDDWAHTKRLLAEAKIADSRPYDLRHSTATTLLIKKVEPRLVMEAMGWSSPSMLLRYQHVVDEMRGEVASALGEALFDGPNGNAPRRATDLATGDQPSNVIPINKKRKKAA